MVMQPIYSNGVTEHQTIEISQESLRSVLNQIEAELINSEVYRRTMAGLQTMLGEASGTAQILVKAVGREAVRLTFQQLAKQYKVVPVPSEKTDRIEQEELESPQKADDNPVNKEIDPNPTPWEEITSLDEITQPSDPSHKPAGETKAPKKTTKAELAAQKAVQEREEVIRRVGQELLRARQARSLSIDQLHRQTLVPPNHITALEIGRLDQLPEDVYIRGFIRRLGAALGLDGVALAASIPEPDPVKSVIPSWYNSIPVPGLQLNSMHLYLGYTALIAGAVGGLSLMSQQNEQGAVAPEQPNPSQSSVSPKAERTKPISKPGLKSSKVGVTVGADISPPEALQF